MENLLKAKVIIELLDDRKYSVLSSFSSQELNKLNGIDLEVLNNLSNADINKTIGDFLDNVEKEKILKLSIQPTAQTQTKPAQPKKDKKPEEAEGVEKKELTLAEKVQQQPPQLLACILNREEEKKTELLSYLDEEKAFNRIN